MAEIAIHIVFPDRVAIDHVVISKGLPRFFVIKNAIAFHHPHFVVDDRVFIEFGLFALRIIATLLGIDSVVAAIDVGRAADIYPLGDDVIIERIGDDSEFGVVKFNVVVKHRLAGVCMIFSPIRRKHTFAVNEFAAVEEIGEGVEAVVVERIGIKGLPTMFHNDILAHLGHLVVAAIIEALTR